ncbi:MAG: hypothetical protein GXO80_09785 [Chlorobi bacterium]|nr:hypothetical protein [Chlorobiota bacterium]
MASKKNMYRLFLLIPSLFYAGISFSQQVFNIEADYVLYEDGEILFFKKNNSGFDCINFYVFNTDIEIDTFKTSQNEFTEEKNNIIPLSDFKKIKSKRLFKFLRRYEFYNNYFSQKRVIYEDNYHIFREEDYTVNNISIEYFRKTYIFYINNEYAILLLYQYRETESLLYVFPLKKHLNAYYYDGYNTELFKVDKHKKKNEIDLPYTCILNCCKIKEKKNNFLLVNKFSGEKLINKKFDKLKITDSFVFGYKKGKKYIYSCNLNKINLKNVSALHYFNDISLNSIQIIQNKQIFWIDKFGNKSKKPKVLEMFVCGNEPSYEKHILKINNKFYYIEKYYDNREELNLCDTSQFILPKKITEIKFYNNGFTDYYYNEDSNINKILFILKNKNNKYSLAEVEKQKNKIIIKTILLKDADTIEYIKQNIRFYKNGLYGYYPQNKKAKYKYLGDFNYYFARFELPDGKKGWTDKKGNEYFDK